MIPVFTPADGAGSSPVPHDASPRRYTSGQPVATTRTAQPTNPSPMTARRLFVAAKRATKTEHPYLTVSVPNIPAARWPGTSQKKV